MIGSTRKPLSYQVEVLPVVQKIHSSAIEITHIKNNTMGLQDFRVDKNTEGKNKTRYP